MSLYCMKWKATSTTKSREQFALFVGNSKSQLHKARLKMRQVAGRRARNESGESGATSIEEKRNRSLSVAPLVPVPS